MVVTKINHRDNAEVAVTENMENDQPNGELVSTNEQNNDENNVRHIDITQYIYHEFL